MSCNKSLFCSAIVFRNFLNACRAFRKVSDVVDALGCRITMTLTFDIIIDTMFQQVPDKETHNKSKSLSSKSRKKCKKKFSAKQKKASKDTKLKNHKFLTTMSTWAENYAVAATWQLKHQIAYWKAKAKALEYENKILHDIIRQNNFDDDDKTVQSDHSLALSESEDQADGSDQDVEINEHGHDHDFEVSEEFIQFLAANAKYKEDAKRERELLRAKFEEETSLQQEPQESTEEKQTKFKELYGSHWQRISALEIALQSQFIHDVDQDKPMYWPNIPLNL